MNDLANCPNCGDIFVKTPFRDVCNKCWKIEDKKYELVYDYLRKRENRSATLHQVVEDTDVEEELILKFIRTGKLKLANFPNLGYPCERCSSLIKTGRMCQACLYEVADEIKKFEREENRREEMEARDKRGTYLSSKDKEE